MVFEPSAASGGAEAVAAPRPLTPRQERFCQAYVLVPNAARAARVAGYTRASAKKQGWRLLTARRVRNRVAEIQAGLAGGRGQELEVLIGKLEVVYRQAIEDRRSYAAARAVELQARIAGVRRRPAPLQPAADNRAGGDDEIEAMIALAEAELRRAAGDDDAWLREDAAPRAKRSA